MSITATLIISFFVLGFLNVPIAVVPITATFSLNFLNKFLIFFIIFYLQLKRDKSPFNWLVIQFKDLSLFLFNYFFITKSSNWITPVRLRSFKSSLSTSLISGFSIGITNDKPESHNIL